MVICDLFGQQPNICRRLADPVTKEEVIGSHEDAIELIADFGLRLFGIQMSVIVGLSPGGAVGVVLLPLVAVVVLPDDEGHVVGPEIVDPEPVASKRIAVHDATIIPGR